MLMEGLQVMIIGMAVVFLILLFLIIAIKISGEIISHFDNTKKTNTQSPETDDQNTIAAIITAVINKFKSEK